MKSLALAAVALLALAAVVLPGLQPAGREKDYHFIEMAVALAVLYAGTYLLARKGKIGIADHRKLWNVLLLGTFLVMGVLSILLVIRINYGWAPLPSFFMLYWHVEAGIAMAVISVFHAAWHWRYYACMLRKGKKGKDSKGAKKCES